MVKMIPGWPHSSQPPSAWEVLTTKSPKMKESNRRPRLRVEVIMGGRDSWLILPAEIGFSPRILFGWNLDRGKLMEIHNFDGTIVESFINCSGLVLVCLQVSTHTGSPHEPSMTIVNCARPFIGPGMNCSQFARRSCNSWKPCCCRMQSRGKQRPFIWRCRETLGEFRCVLVNICWWKRRILMQQFDQS